MVIRTVCQTLVLNKNDITVWNNKGSALNNLEPYAEAITCYDHV